jgi:threonine synthase
MPSQKVMYRSTRGLSPAVDRRTAILESQPPDGGLYVPTRIPQFKGGEIESLKGASLPEVGYAVMDKFLRDEIPDDYLMDMCKDALNFEIPIEHVYGNVFTQRLGEGPTGAFKDTAARMLARESSYYIQQGEDSESWLLVATSGDTGAAIAGAFHGIEGINVIVAYPGDNVTKRQAALMNTYGDNIIALECEGKFKGLQDMFMEAFSDKDLKKYKLWSANSIGIGRAQPQVIHAVYPLTKEEIVKNGDPVFVVPSGNMGHIYAFLLAKKMGAYDERAVVANNLNNVFDRFMKTGEYDVTDTISTISNAMDVNDPSNARRVVGLYRGRLIKDREFKDNNGNVSTVCRIDRQPDMESMRKDIWTTTVDDLTTKLTIKYLYNDYRAKFEPHGGVGMRAEQKYRSFTGHGKTSVVMETAHIGKFPEVLEELNIPVETPEYMSEALKKKSLAVPFSNSYEDFKEFMISGEAERIIRRQKSKVK